MHRTVALASAAMLVVFGAIAVATGSEQGEKDPNLIWSDEFDGTSLDLSKWEYRQLGPRRDAVNVEEAVSLDGKGHLLITTRKVGDAYQTGMIGTQGRFERAFGYFECRVKLQTQEGHWSAFWLQSPLMGEKAYDPAKDGTEIDIFEFLVKRGDKIQHTLHWGGYGEKHESAAHVHDQPGLREGWHTVGVEWTEKEYVFYVDGKETWRSDKGISHIPQYIILSLEVGNWGGDISKVTLPDSVLFDYVRVYKVRPAASSETLHPALAHRWLFVMRGMDKPENVERTIALFPRAAKAGYNAVVLSDGNLYSTGSANASYADNLKRLQKAAAENGLDLIPGVMPIGYASGILAADPNLAEGGRWAGFWEVLIRR